MKTTAVFDDDAAQRGIDRFITTNDGRRIRVYIDATGGTSYSTGAGNMSYKKDGGVIEAASGVYVTGPGSDIDDRVPAMLSPGEFVLDKQATDQLGIGNLQQRNEGIPPARATHTAPVPTAKEIGAEVAKAVAQALQGATLTLTGVDYLANSTAARINTAIARGV